MRIINYRFAINLRAIIISLIRIFISDVGGIQLNLIEHCWTMLNEMNEWITLCFDKRAGSNRLELDRLLDKGRWNRRLASLVSYTIHQWCRHTCLSSCWKLPRRFEMRSLRETAYCFAIAEFESAVRIVARLNAGVILEMCKCAISFLTTLNWEKVKI